ncbi:SRPBCC domain-containing protein [Nocardia concava]|uniref:SRPBCC domain-containing protein n=1 Tax=Nocardia concava TaxID=257281 RepID=UPI000594A054|nr:SRPBCC domain-containing protein [Nocardia concava]
MAFVIDRTVEIDAPAELVWQVLTDVEKYGEWNPFCLECRTSLEPGAPIDMKVRLVGPKPKQQREFIHSVTPGEEFSYRMKPAPLGLLSSERSHVLTSLADGRTRYLSHFQLNGPLAPVVSGLLGKALTTGFEGMTNAVKTRAEALKAVRD